MRGNESYIIDFNERFLGANDAISFFPWEDEGFIEGDGWPSGSWEAAQNIRKAVAAFNTLLGNDYVVSHSLYVKTREDHEAELKAYYEVREGWGVGC